MERFGGTSVAITDVLRGENAQWQRPKAVDEASPNVVRTGLIYCSTTLDLSSLL
jgi:hypothetical protein